LERLLIMMDRQIASLNSSLSLPPYSNFSFFKVWRRFGNVSLTAIFKLHLLHGVR
jgi:hypothetical protein